MRAVILGLSSLHLSVCELQIMGGGACFSVSVESVHLEVDKKQHVDRTTKRFNHW